MHPQSNSRSSWASSDDNGGFYLIVIVACSCAGAYLLWDSYHGPISSAVMQLFHREIAFARHFTDRYDLADRQMMRADPVAVSLRDLYGIARDVGMLFRIPAGLFMLGLAGWCMTRAAPARFRRAFDFDGLAREQAASFRTTAAFVGRRLGLVPPAPKDPRPADYALTAAEWVARYATDEHGAFSSRMARAHLVRQLGPHWSGLDGASAQVRCLFAICALHLAEHRAEAVDLLGKVSAALAGRDPSREGPEKPLGFPASVSRDVQAVLVDYPVAAPALAAMNRHAYTHTALMSLLTAARARAGVLAPGQFAWLKLVDRPLWYALHSLGFETEIFDRYMHPNPRAEAVGARDHWAYERLAGGPVIEPNVERALDALRRAASSRAGPSKTHS